jgi:hypothetical protein
MTRDDIIPKNDDAVFSSGIIPVKYAGRWFVPGSSATHRVQFPMTKKPNWLHRTMMRVLLGWEWRDDK